jgi:hypothetical protein
VTLTTIPALIMRAWTASADLGIVRMNQTTRVMHGSLFRADWFVLELERIPEIGMGIAWSEGSKKDIFPW